MCRFVILSVTLGAIAAVQFHAAHAAQEKKEVDPKLPDPTAEQLAAAKQAYGKHGANYEDGTKIGLKHFLTVHIFGMRRATDADLKDLPNLPFYFALTLSGAKVTDAGLKELRNLRNLTVLIVADTQVSSEGMKELKHLKNLRYLNLECTKVTDVGLKELKELRNLKELILRNPNVRPLRGFTETPVTDAGVAELQRALPKCDIYR
jgi:Leucine Rich repeat